MNKHIFVLPLTVAAIVLSFSLYYLYSEKDGKLPALSEKNGKLPALSEKNGKLPALGEKNSKLPALSEKDGKLIEAFVHEMNLLVELQREDDIPFKYQLAKLDAAYNDLSSLGSDIYPMLIMRSIALGVSIRYSLAHTYWNSGKYENYDNNWKKEYDKALDDASQSRENFLKAYHLYQPGTTILESNKFLLNNGIAELPTDPNSQQQ